MQMSSVELFPILNLNNLNNSLSIIFKVTKMNFIEDNISQSFRIREKNGRAPFLKVGHFLIGEILGKGGFATVHKAIEVHTKMEVAVKILDLTTFTRKQVQQLRIEIGINKSLNHPNIVRIYEAVWTDSKLYIFMELVKGKELFQYVSKHGPMRQCLAMKVFHQICCAVKYLHEKGIAHRDIKTQNIMIDSQSNAKLIDFGLAQSFNSQEEMFQTFCGSPSYTAPEMQAKRKYKGVQIDMWCLGVALYVMLEASLPFDHSGDNMRTLNWDRPTYSSAEANELYKAIFKRSDQRMKLNDLLKCPLFQKYFLMEQEFHETTDEQFAAQISANGPIVKQISTWLRQDEGRIRMSLLERELGPAYCIYQLRVSQQQCNFMKNKTMELRDSKTIENRSLLTKRTSINRKLMSPKTQKNRCESQLKASGLKLLPLATDVSEGTEKKGGQKKPNTMEVIEKKNKQALGIRIKFQNRRLIGKNIDLDAKPRLRRDSAESPKRLIDCVKRYS